MNRNLKVNNFEVAKKTILSRPLLCSDFIKKSEQGVAFVAKHGNMEKVNNTIDGKTIYVYNRDKSILYFYTNNLYNSLVNLKIHYNTYIKHLTKGTYYLGRYLFSKVFEPNAIYKPMTLLEFSDKLAKDRKKFSLGSSVNLKQAAKGKNSKSKDLIIFI